jgi:hypothetical protein
MNKYKAIELLQNQINVIESVKQKERFLQDLKKWKRITPKGL